MANYFKSGYTLKIDDGSHGYYSFERVYTRDNYKEGLDIDIKPFIEKFKAEYETEKIPYNEIDKEMRPIINILNAKGWITCGCCQGHYREFYDGEMGYSYTYIYFCDRVKMPRYLFPKIEGFPVVETSSLGKYHESYCLVRDISFWEWHPTVGKNIPKEFQDEEHKRLIAEITKWAESLPVRAPEWAIEKSYRLYCQGPRGGVKSFLPESKDEIKAILQDVNPVDAGIIEDLHIKKTYHMPSEEGIDTPVYESPLYLLESDEMLPFRIIIEETNKNGLHRVVTKRVEYSDTEGLERVNEQIIGSTEWRENC